MPRSKAPQQSSKLFVENIVKGLKTAAVNPDIRRYTPHDKQELFHESLASQRLFIGGNRSGKTVGGATEAVWWLTHTHPYKDTPEPPVRGRCVSVDFINGVQKIVRPEIAKWCPPSALRGGSWETAYDKAERTLHFENGSFLEFMSYDQDLDKFAGTSRHFIWFDEEPPQEIYLENRMRLLDVGGHLWVTMTPVEGMTWIYDDLYLAANENQNIFVVEVDQAENPYLNQSSREEFLLGLSEDERKARVQGKFVQMGGLIYKNFRPANIIEPFSPPKEWMRVAGLDHGLNNPTAWLWAAINPDGDLFVFDEHYENDQVVSYHAQRVHAKNQTHSREPDYYVGDPSIRNRDPITGTSVLLEYMEYGLPIILGNNDVLAGINRVASMLEGRVAKGQTEKRPQLYIGRNCRNLLYEIQRYRWATWANKRADREKNKKEEPHKKDDHACDALRYIVASRPQVEDFSVPEKNYIKYASQSVSPYDGRIDEDLTAAMAQSRDIDPTLGSEW